MKRNFLILIGLIITGLLYVSGQNPAPWFTAKEVANKVWVISDHGSDNIYLVEGDDTAMLIDNGLGAADLRSYVKTLTKKPVIVVITHGHPDHAGSNYQFEKVYIHPADAEAAKAMNRPERRAASSKTMQGGDAPSENELYKAEPLDTKLIAVSDGHVFDLGGRRMQVMETPGHTPGGICLLDIRNKILFTGDNNNTLVWLFLENCTPLHKCLETLEKQQSRIAEFNTLMPGHGAPMSSDFINDQIACVKAILAGTCEAKEYKSFAGNSKICAFGQASVAFNPDNL
ncbi:MAG: MBL fold metallo-hydrolase [Bacteroidales bacterium]|nr:MBL fold metallo-hydrolase [Bacteroidales bacterium]